MTDDKRDEARIETSLELQQRTPASLRREDFAPGIVPQDAIYGAQDYVTLYVGTDTNLANATLTPVPYSGVSNARGSAITYDLASGSLFIQEKGTYYIHVMFQVEGAVAVAGYFDCSVYYDNNSNNRILSEVRPPANVGGNAFHRGSTGRFMTFTENFPFPAQLNVYFFQNTGGTLSMKAPNFPGSVPGCWFSIMKMNDQQRRLYSDVGIGFVGWAG